MSNKPATLPTSLVKLTPGQEKQWTETRASIMWECPAFSAILISMMSDGTNGDLARFTSEIPIAGTDGRVILLNPETFFKYTLPQRVFILAHEVGHAMFGHCDRAWEYGQSGKVPTTKGLLQLDLRLLNEASDYVINALLVECEVGSCPPDALYDISIGTSKDASVDVYAKLYKTSKAQKDSGNPQKPCNGGGGNPNPGKGNQKSFDVHGAPGSGTGQDVAKAVADRNQAQWDMAIAGAMASARAQGKLPAALERFLGELLEPKVAWKEQIRALFARVIGRDGYDWRKLDRRLIVRGIGAPGRIGYGAKLVVVAIDTSGSIGPVQFDTFMGEIGGMLEDVLPELLVVIWIDAKIGRVDEIYDAGDFATLRGKGIPGGGGTDFRPAFDYVNTLDAVPDCMVYLTDGAGSFPRQAPAYPVIWGNIQPGRKYPFGDVVDIPA